MAGEGLCKGSSEIWDSEQPRTKSLYFMNFLKCHTIVPQSIEKEATHDTWISLEEACIIGYQAKPSCLPLGGVKGGKGNIDIQQYLPAWTA
eukprot:899750-Pelagomonas_calceolata.AAC.1